MKQLATDVGGRIRELTMIVAIAMVPLTIGAGHGSVPAQDRPAETAAPPKAESDHPAWTFDTALAQLQMYPRDVFLQYVALKLAQREGFDAAPMLNIRGRTQRDIAVERREDVDLFSLFSGSLAVQESLQLDAMRPDSSFRRDAVNALPKDTVAMTSLTGPTVASHPWAQMLDGRRPGMSALAAYVPADQYYIRFRSVSRMLDVIDGGGLFAKHLWTQTGEQSFLRDTESKLRQQLAVETNPLARPFYDLVVQEIAITGSDPFVNEGSDVTLLFRYEQDLVFRTQMDQYLTQAMDSIAGATRSEGTFEGTPFVHLTSPGRAVHVFSAYPAAGLHVRSNSRVAFERTLHLIAGRATPGVTSLAATDEFQYIRTLMPFGADDEDGLIYLSDPFIRRLVGPELKLTEHRRLRCFSSLNMIGHAATMFEAEQGRVASSLDELQSANCLPDGFDSGAFACPCGGSHSLSADGRTGVCSHHGDAGSLTPCCEIPVDHVNETEAAAYRQFVQAYSEYWRTFFDPIAIKVQATPERYRLETIVLPLINNSMYQALAATIGGEPAVFTGGVTKDAVMSLNVAVRKDVLLSQSGWTPPEDLTDNQPGNSDEPIDDATALSRRASSNNMRQIGLAMHNYHDVYNHFPSASGAKPDGKPLLSWRVHLLPYLDESELYAQFNRDEPWDSPTNRPLIARMPDLYRSPRARLKPGHTTYVTIRGKNTVYPEIDSVSIRDIVDGTSNTGMLIDAAPEFAVEWTRPDDLELDPVIVRKAMTERFPSGGLILFCDGSVRTLFRDPPALNDQMVRNLFVRNDGNVLALNTVLTDPFVPTNDPLGLDSVMGGKLREADIYRFIKQGLGDSIGFHVCDDDPSLDLQLTSMLPELFTGRRNSIGLFDGDMVWIGMAIASITAPVYIDVEVQDAEVVDQFLAKVDEGAAIEARKQNEQFFWFGFDKDFYKMQVGQTQVRSFVVSFGPIRLRYFFTRVGDRLVVASKLDTVRQLIETHARGGDALPEDGATPRAHAQLTIHRDQWQQILNSMRASWDEAARNACLDNLGPMMSAAVVAARAGSTDGSTKAVDGDAIMARAASLYGGLHLCPCGGRYVRTADGRIGCSVHGDADHPMQPAPTDDAAASQAMLDSFSEIRVLLSFLDDGLHAVLEIDRTGR